MTGEIKTKRKNESSGYNDKVESEEADNWTL
jgi:hypothetical protein